MKQHLRLAVFGIRSLPPSDGAAGSDTVADELYPLLAAKGHTVVVYCRRYRGTRSECLPTYKGMSLVHHRTVSKGGFDTLFHSCVATLHIIFRNTADVVHIHNGGNSLFALPLRIAGKRVCVTQDGIDWQRKKWSWYGRWFLRLSMHMTAYFPNRTIFDNVFAKEIFEAKFGKVYAFIPHGAVLTQPQGDDTLTKLGLSAQGYFLFVGRFIPEKGIHHLIQAYRRLKSDKKLVIVGGSPNPNSDYEKSIRSMVDERIIFPGYIYGDQMLQLMKGAYCYIHPSEIEGMSPVLLTAMGMETPVICSDIRENRYVVGDTVIFFRYGDEESLREQMEYALQNRSTLCALAQKANIRARKNFSWDAIALSYEKVFREIS